MSIPHRVPAHTRKHVPETEFLPWACARFQTEADRDGFLCEAADLPTTDVQVEPMPDESRGAMVRWRPGQFLGLNDVAYAHGGRIAVTRRRGR